MPARANTAVAAVPAWVRALASRRLTVLFFLATAGASLAVAQGQLNATAPMLLPLGLLVANIGAAIFANARFRADLPLLLFHLCLVALVTLVGLARLTYMEGKATLTSGTAFDGVLETEARGLLHRGPLQALQFANEGFTESYYRRGKYRATYNRVRWQDDGGQWHLAEIGDDHPLILQGYRIFTTANRGFAPLFHWQPVNGESGYGTVQLNDRRTDSLAPTMEWQLPGGMPARVTLNMMAPAEAQRDDRSDLGARELAHTLVLKVGDARHDLQPGQKVDLPTGTLTYVRLDSWMGYLITYDPTQPWIMATVLIGVFSLVWFYWRRIW